MNDIEQRVKKVIAEQLSINEADIKNESASSRMNLLSSKTSAPILWIRSNWLWLWKTLSRLKSRTINKKSCVRFNKRLTTSKPTLSNICHL